MFSMNRVCGRVALACALATVAPIAVAWAQPTSKPMTLAQALDTAREGSPLLGAANATVEAARARETQAGAGINPELSFNIENFSGNGLLSGMDSSESTIGISQQLELGGKREARSDTAGRQADVSVILSLIARADLDRAVRERFADLAAAEERLELASLALERAIKLSGVAKSLVDAGREPPLRLLRAQAQEAEAQAQLSIATVNLAVAQNALSSLWGGQAPGLEAVGPWEFQRSEDRVNSAPDETLDYRLSKAEHDVAEAALRLEKANAWIDVTVSAGMRRFEATGDQAWVAGVNIPIPIQNTNAGGIAAARAEDRAAEFRVSVALIDAVRMLNDARAAFEAADARVQALENTAVLQAEEALNLAQIGYEAGRFQLIDVLDAEEAFSSIRNALIDAKLARARAAAALVRSNAT